jgi:phosphoserine phosphatase
MPKRPVRLVVFDLDGTLLRGDTVCLALARRLGKTDRMLQFERLTDMELIKVARYEMAEWYWNVQPDTLLEWLNDLVLAPGAEEACRHLRRRGVPIAIASMTWEFAVEWFARRLDAGYWTGTSLDLATWEIRHSSPEHKTAFLRSLAAKLGLAPDEVAAVGDSFSDYEMLRAAGRRFFVGSKQPPSDIEAVMHLPGADLSAIARLITGEPGHGSGVPSGAADGEAS